MTSHDLFSWRQEADAAERVAQAEAARADAARRVRCAPHGDLRNRQARLREATADALKAEVELQRLQAGEGDSGR